ncbi:SprB repeat-containing protein, partial [Neolewinella persica]|uniref:SprB repeat-containing protein n=1 Tax=Neolewinella persica TaxID=70998 RepID=UPI0005C5BDFC
MFNSTWLALTLALICVLGSLTLDAQNDHVLVPSDWTAQLNRMVLTGPAIAGIGPEKNYPKTVDEGFGGEVKVFVEPAADLDDYYSTSPFSLSLDCRFGLWFNGVFTYSSQASAFSSAYFRANHLSDNGPVSYEWSNGETDNQLDNPDYGSYSVTVTDQIDFISFGEFLNQPDLYGGVSYYDASCTNTNDGQIDVRVAVSNGPFMMSLYDENQGLPILIGQSVGGINPANLRHQAFGFSATVPPGLYRVEYVLDSGVEYEYYITVGSGLDYYTQIESLAPSSCGLANGSAEIAIYKTGVPLNNPIPGTEVDWGDGSGSNALSRNDLVPGSYSVTVTASPYISNNCTCTWVEEFTIVDNGNSSVAIDAGRGICPQGSVCFYSPNICRSASVTLTNNMTSGTCSDPSDTPTYQWFRVDGSDDINDAYPILGATDEDYFDGMISAGTSAMIFRRTYCPCDDQNDPNGGLAYTNESYLRVSGLDVSLLASEEEICAGDEVTLTALDSGVPYFFPEDGSGTISYSWSVPGESGEMITVNPTETTTYRVTVTDEICAIVGTVTILVPTDLSFDEVAVQTSCPDVAPQFASGSISLTVTGGTVTGDYSYTWSANAGPQSGPMATGLPVGTYSVTVTDANSCQINTSVEVLEEVLPALNIIYDFSIDYCLGDEVQYSVENPVAGVDYQWDLISGNPPFILGESIDGVLDGPGPIRVRYTGDGQAPDYGNFSGPVRVTATYPSGCIDRTRASIFVHQSPEIYAEATPVTCGEINGGIRFYWPSHGGSTHNPTFGFVVIDGIYVSGELDINGANELIVNNIPPGTYTPRFEQPTLGRCIYDFPSVTVVGSPPLSIMATPTPVSCHGDADGALTVVPNGGTVAGDYNYAWSPNAGIQSGATATGLGQGTYMVTVTDDNGCSQVATAEITQPAAMTVTMDGAAL